LAILNTCATLVPHRAQARAQDRDILLTFPELPFEPAEALHVDASL